MQMKRYFSLTLSLLIPVFMISGCASLAAYNSGSKPDTVKISTSESETGSESSNDLKTAAVSYDENVSGIHEEMTESSETEANGEDIKNKYYENMTDQELIDYALDYCQASNEFWEKGDLYNAIDCLDNAYSLILRVNAIDNPLILQEKEDLRITISKRVVEVYSSRHSVANGHHKAIPLDMNEHVEKALNLFKGRERKFFLEAYARSGRYRPAIVRELKKSGLPEELSWLPLIESGFKVRALSSARALGMWQFIASTGYKYGLKRDSWIDERMDIEESTRAAIAYLTELHQIFGEWTTALASYNCGEGRVLRLINEQKINYLDNFWDLYERLPRETAFYVPKFLAVLLIVNDPEAHGFTLPPLEEELEYEDITTNKQVLLKTIAREIDVEYDLLKDLNSELRQDMTPNAAYNLRVPKGKSETLLAKIDNIPVYNPPVPAYVTHTVRSGDSLSAISQKYRTSINAIMRLNNLSRKEYLRVGWKLKIPTGHVASTAYSAADSASPVEYIVKKGDSLWKIANQFNTTVNTIKAINNLESSSLNIGQKLRISSNITEIKPGGTQEYVVQKGDSPYLIAKRHSMNLYDFLKLNNLTANSKIFPGQMVQIVAQ